MHLVRLGEDEDIVKPGEGKWNEPQWSAWGHLRTVGGQARSLVPRGHGIHQRPDRKWFCFLFSLQV